MALGPPMEVVQLLQSIGIDWPMINEDSHARVLSGRLTGVSFA